MDAKKALSTKSLLIEIPAIIAIILFIITFSNYYVEGGVSVANWIQDRRIEIDPIIGVIGMITLARFYWREYRTRETTHGYITALTALGTIILVVVYCEATGLGTSAPLYTDLYSVFFTQTNAVLSELFAVSMIAAYFFLLRVKKGRAGLVTIVILSSLILTFFSDTDLAFVLRLPILSDISNWLVSWVWSPIGWPFAGDTAGTIQILAMFVVLSRIFVLKEKIRG
jgi:hypothetical protein